MWLAAYRLETFKDVSVNCHCAHSSAQVYPNFTTITYDRSRLSQKQFLYMKERSSCYSFFKFDEKNDESKCKIT